MTAELLVDSRSVLGEGPVWHQELQQLFWVDIEGRKINRFDPAADLFETRSFDKMPGAIVPVDRSRFLVAFEDGLAIYDWSSKALDYINDLGRETPAIRTNDGKCDPAGRFWIGTMHLEQVPRAGALYCLTGDLTLTEKVPDRTISNGLAWSADGGTMYYIDSPEFRVTAFDFDPATGGLQNRRMVIEVAEEMGAPDGMTIDRNDKLWVAHWGGRCVRQWDPETGTVLQKIEVPAPHVTSCAFGGPDLDELYITTARSGMTDAQLKAYPMSGGIFAIKPGSSGKPTRFFNLAET